MIRGNQTQEMARELASNPSSPVLREDPLRVARLMIESALETGDTSRSLLHANFRGTHSIMLYDRDVTGGGKIRMFVSEEGKHTKYETVRDDFTDFKLLPHDHRYDLAIVPLVGALLHTQWEIDPTEKGWLRLYESFFRSAVGHSEFELTPTGNRPHLTEAQFDMLETGSVHTLDHTTIHTLASYNPEHPLALASWMVVEGPLKKLTPHIYSRQQNPQLSSQGLYIPASHADVEHFSNLILDQLPD